MNNQNETVVIELFGDARLRLHSQITNRMESLGLNPCDYKALGLGFELPATWPVDEQHQPTIAQLVMVAVKLDMRLIIHDLNLVART